MEFGCSLLEATKPGSIVSPYLIASSLQARSTGSVGNVWADPYWDTLELKLQFLKEKYSHADDQDYFKSSIYDDRARNSVIDQENIISSTVAPIFVPTLLSIWKDGLNQIHPQLRTRLAQRYLRRHLGAKRKKSRGRAELHRRHRHLAVHTHYS